MLVFKSVLVGVVGLFGHPRL